MIWSQTLPIPFNYYYYLWVEKMLTSFRLLFTGIRLMLAFLSHTNPKQARFAFLFFFSSRNIYILFVQITFIYTFFMYFVHCTNNGMTKGQKWWIRTWLFDVSYLIKIKNGSAESKWEGKKPHRFLSLTLLSWWWYANCQYICITSPTVCTAIVRIKHCN